MGGQGADAGSIAYSERLAPTLRAGDSGTNRVPDIVYTDVARTLTAEHDSSPCADRGQNPAKPPRRYIIRRLTPLECCRLQGFPDWWTEGCETHPITMEQATNKTLFLHVNPMGAIKGADSQKYKMWGNGIALPCALHVMQGVARVLEETR